MTSPEESKSLVRRWMAEVWNKGNLAVADEIFASTYLHRTPTTTLPNLAAFTQMINDFRAGVPDVQVTIQDLLTDGDKIITRWILTGTHRGELLGIAPTNKPVTLSGITIQRIENGRISESWAEFNAGGLRQYLQTP
jgi:steroid delta-isomerase-like uncharacterized protein